VNASLFFASEHVQGGAEVSSKCHRSKEKGIVTKAKSLFLGGFSPKNLCKEKMPRPFIFISIKPSKDVLLGF